MIERKRKQHDLADDDLPVANHGLLLDPVHPQDAQLRMIQDGRRKEATLFAEGCHRERGAPQISGRDRSVPRRPSKAFDSARELEEREPVRVTYDRNHESGLGRRGDTDVVVSLVNNLIVSLIDRRVEHGMPRQGIGHGFDDEGQVAEPDPAALRFGQ